jgi:hypothetical protein
MAALLLALAASMSAACEDPTPPNAGTGGSGTIAAGGDLGGLIASMARPYPPGDARYLSSNAYDYTRDNPAFDAVVAEGYGVLQGLEDYLIDKDARGLDGYLVCIAIERITRCDLKQFEEFTWADAGRFQVQWNKYLEQMPSLVDGVLGSGVSLEDQAKEIVKLGAPAVPFLVDHADSIDEDDGNEIAEALAAIVPDAEPGDTVEEFSDNNKGAISQLRAYIENR